MSNATLWAVLLYLPPSLLRRTCKCRSPLGSCNNFLMKQVLPLREGTAKAGVCVSLGGSPTKCPGVKGKESQVQQIDGYRSVCDLQPH